MIALVGRSLVLSASIRISSPSKPGIGRVLLSGIGRNAKQVNLAVELAHFKSKIRNPQWPAPCHHLRFGVLSVLLFSEAQRRTPWLGGHLFWLKSASVLKSTAICQPMATRHQSFNSRSGLIVFPNARVCGRSFFCGLKSGGGGAKKVHRNPR